MQRYVLVASSHDRAYSRWVCMYVCMYVCYACMLYVSECSCLECSNGYKLKRYNKKMMAVEPIA